MEGLKISKEELESAKLASAQEHFEKIQEIVESSNIDNTPPKPKDENGETTEKTMVQMMFNYVVTFIVFGWLFFLISAVLAFPGTRIAYETLTTKYNYLRTFLIFVIYSVYLSANPYVPFMQMVYTMTVFMFFESIDWWSLVTLSPGKTRPITTPIFWDEGLQNILTANGVDLGVKNTIEQVNNLSFTFEEMDKFLGEIDLLTDTVNTLKRASITMLQSGVKPNPADIFVQSSFIDVTGELTPEKINANIAKLNDFEFTRGDAMDSMLATNKYILKYGSEGSSPLKQALHDANAVKVKYTPPTVQEPNVRKIEIVNSKFAKASTDVTKNREKVLGVFDDMGIRKKWVNVSMYMFFVVAGIMLAVSYYLLSYDKPMYRMKKIYEMGIDLEEKTEEKK